MPPPNITGRLHVGHALFTTIQDAMIRRIEASKDRLRGGAGSARSCLAAAIDAMLRMAHPLTPFTTEEIRGRIGGPPLITSQW